MSDDSTRIVVFPEAELPAALKRGAIAVLEGAYGPSGRSVEERMGRPLADARYAPVCMLVVEGDTEPTVLAYLAIVSKPITHGGRLFRACGLGAVSTLPSRRGEGHAGRLVRAAFERIASGALASEAPDSPDSPDLGVFTCDESLAGWYAGLGADLGWEVMPWTVVVGGTREVPFRADGLRNASGEGKATLMAFLSEEGRGRRGEFVGTDSAVVDVYLELREGDLW